MLLNVNLYRVRKKIEKQVNGMINNYSPWNSCKETPERAESYGAGSHFKKC